MVPARKPVDKAIVSIKPYLEKDNILKDSSQIMDSASFSICAPKPFNIDKSDIADIITPIN